MAPLAIPLLWGALKPKCCVSIIRARSLVTDSERLFNYLYVGVKYPASTRDAPVVLPKSLGEQSEGQMWCSVQWSPSVATLVSAGQRGSPPATLFPTQRGWTAWGYSMLWQCRMQFCSRPTPFLHSHEKNFYLIGQTTAASKSKIKSNYKIFLTLEKLFQSICSVDYKTWCKTSDR